jgi:hypothetical protein
MGQTQRKPMASATVSIDREIIRELVDRLEEISSVESAYFLDTPDAFSVWVGLSPDDARVRSLVYEIEDALTEQHDHIVFDFHVVALPAGRSLRDFMTSAHPVYHRAA